MMDLQVALHGVGPAAHSPIYERPKERAAFIFPGDGERFLPP